MKSYRYAVLFLLNGEVSPLFIADFRRQAGGVRRRVMLRCSYQFPSCATKFCWFCPPFRRCTPPSPASRGRDFSRCFWVWFASSGVVGGFVEWVLSLRRLFAAPIPTLPPRWRFFCRVPSYTTKLVARPNSVWRCFAKRRGCQALSLRGFSNPLPSVKRRVYWIRVGRRASARRTSAATRRDNDAVFVFEQALRTR